MKWLRVAGLALLALSMLLAVSAAFALWIWRDVPAAQLEAQYASADSRFLHIDGARLHYRDEGSGPPILLLHGSFSNLLSWDPWVEALKAHYRVVRLDLTAFGLTGPEPNGDYSDARTLLLLERFVDAVGLRRFDIAGTSLGARLAILYGAKHPQRIGRLVLLNPGIAEMRALGPGGLQLPAVADVLGYVTPRVLAATMLRSRAGDPQRITEEHIDRWYDLWMREGNRQAMLQRLRTHGSADVTLAIEQVRAPVLVLVGAADPRSPPPAESELRQMLKGSTTVRLVSYADVGHPALEEAGARIAEDVRAWLEGGSR